jgi:hypothetical protein
MKSPSTASVAAQPRSKFDHAFWMLNTIEMGERLAYYNRRVIPAGWLSRKMRTFEAMLVGMFMVTVGVVVAGWTQSAWLLVLGILFFSTGEMTTGPKKNEHLGLIAPPGKKGL